MSHNNESESAHQAGAYCEAIQTMCQLSVLPGVKAGTLIVCEGRVTKRARSLKCGLVQTQENHNATERSLALFLFMSDWRQTSRDRRE